MTTVWIIHREKRVRAALARLAGVGESAVQAAPSDPALANAPPADVVLLGLDDDYEAELQFAHRSAPRLPGAHWVLLPRRTDVERARRLFDTLDRVVLAYPPDARTLREMVRAPLEPAGGGAAPLSARPLRDALSERFARWFADLELPELLRILDPRLADVHVFICGEAGTGRGLLARYVHSFSGTASSPLIQLVGSRETRPEELLDAIEAQGLRFPATPAGCSLLLEGVDELPAATQQRIRGWIDYGLPPGVLNAGCARWIGTAGSGGAGLEEGLRRALDRFRLAIPPVRDRTALIAPFVADTCQSWCAARGERPRRFGEDALAVLEEYPWPGNLRELEDTVVQTLLASPADPLGAQDLRLEGAAFAPLADDDLGAPLDDDTEVPVVTATAEPEALDELHAVIEPEAPSDGALRRMIGAVEHEIRNPLTTIRTFAELLPRDHQDPEFRARFVELVGSGVERIDEAVGALAQFAALEPPLCEPVDVAGMLEELLDLRRDLIHRRHLLVLKELDREQPLALGDPLQLRTAFDGLLRKCLELAPERGDVYFASRHHDAGLQGQPSLRVLVRFNGPRGGGRSVRKVAGVTPAENAIEFSLAEVVARAHGGSLAVHAGDADETVLVLDLPAPG
ncbi:MAG: histidine kinase dimerization/phospho-acceptor domain-containing protein [Myxococcota bacterium]